jgi:hypothetical protein
LIPGKSYEIEIVGRRFTDNSSVDVAAGRVHGMHLENNLSKFNSSYFNGEPIFGLWEYKR